MIVKTLAITALTMITFQAVASNELNEEFKNGNTTSKINIKDKNVNIINSTEMPDRNQIITNSTFPSNVGMPTNKTVFTSSGNSLIPFGTTSSSSHVTKTVNGIVVKDEKTETPVTSIPVQKN